MEEQAKKQYAKEPNITEAQHVLEIKDYSLSLYKNKKPIQILNKMNFYINKGETLGIVGESGCGKSMTALSIMQLIMGKQHTEGEILFNGKNILEQSKKEMRNIRGDLISMIFQEPMTSLNPTLTIGQQLAEVFVAHKGMPKKQAREKALEALKMVNIAEPQKRIDCYPHELSGGMRQRVMIAMALSSRPQLLIADEPTTALDVTIQAQILALLKDLKDELGTSVMLITHDLGVVAEVCTRAVILYCGRVVEETPVDKLFLDPLHPYTEGLIKSLPEIGDRKSLYVIPGNVPSTGNYPPGCPFSARCEYAGERCKAEEPPEVYLEDGRRVRCFRHVKNQ